MLNVGSRNLDEGPTPVTESVRIGKDTKEELKMLKMHPRETYDDMIRRLVEAYRRCQGRS